MASVLILSLICTSILGLVRVLNENKAIVYKREVKANTDYFNTISSTPKLSAMAFFAFAAAAFTVPWPATCERQIKTNR